MGKVNVLKRRNVYQYKFEIAPVDGKRKFKNKSGFLTKNEAMKEGIKAYTEYMNTGHAFTPNEISYSDYLDYWMKEHCEVNLKYHTIEAYKSIIRIHVKPKIGHYKLSTITTANLQEFINKVYLDGSYSKNFLKNILKVIKTSFGYAYEIVHSIKSNPADKVRLPRYDIPDSDPAHIFTKEEIDRILSRFHNFRDTHATRLIEAGADIKAVSKRLGHSKIETTYNIYVRVTTKMESDIVTKFEAYATS